VVAVVGIVLFLFGSGYLRVLAFPIAFLLLMIPIPTLLFNQIAFPLQLLASRLGEVMVAAAGIPVLREGNIISLASTRLEVAEACSGIRSLVSLFATGVVYGYFVDRRSVIRVLLATATVPLAIVANALRVAGTGIAAHHFGAAAADGFFHSFSGWLVFISALLMLTVIARALRVAARPRVDSRSTAPIYT
jgi:exosortase